MNIENRHISIWGDSIMKGVILDETEGRYRVLEENCVHKFGGKNRGRYYKPCKFWYDFQQGSRKNSPFSEKGILRLRTTSCWLNTAETIATTTGQKYRQPPNNLISQKHR